MIRRPGLVLATIAAVSLAGCGPSGAVQPPSRAVAPYSGRAAELFDDGIEAHAVGLAFDHGIPPKADPLLRERVQQSEAVVRVKVQTVSAKTDGLEKRYQLALRSVEKLAGAHPPSLDFTVAVTKSSDAHGIVKNFESRLIGYSFIAFVREFVRADGEREIHFHLAPDTSEVRSAVTEAVILGEVEKK